MTLDCEWVDLVVDEGSTRPERVLCFLVAGVCRRAFSSGGDDECLTCTSDKEKTLPLAIFLHSLRIGQQLWRAVLANGPRRCSDWLGIGLMLPWCESCSAALLSTVGVFVQATRGRSAESAELAAGCIGCRSQESVRCAGMRPIEFALAGHTVGLIHDRIPPLCVGCDRIIRECPDMISEFLPS